MPDTLPPRGFTPNEAAKLFRISPERVRAMIARGELGALNLGSGEKPRYVILPVHLEAFTRRHAAATPVKPVRRKRRTVEVDFYPD